MMVRWRQRGWNRSATRARRGSGAGPASGSGNRAERAGQEDLVEVEEHADPDDHDRDPVGAGDRQAVQAGGDGDAAGETLVGDKKGSRNSRVKFTSAINLHLPSATRESAWTAGWRPPLNRPAPCNLSLLLVTERLRRAQKRLVRADVI
jgi:hypothetical protein